MTRESATASSSPTDSPTSASRPAPETVMRTTEARDAPSASLTPISCRRCAT